MNASIAQKTDQLSTDNKSLKIYENECAQGIVKTNDFKSIMKDASIEAQEYAVQTKGAAGSAQVFSAKQEQALKELKATANASKGAAVAMKAVSIAINMAAMWAISTVVSIVAEKITELANASKLAAEKAAAFAESVNSVFQDMSGNLSTLSSLNDEYQKLSKGVNEAGKNVSLSTNEYDRYKEIISDISDIMPNLTTFFNSQGEKIAFAKGELADLNKEYEAYLQQQAKEFLTNGDESGNTVQDVLDNYNYNKEFGLFENLGNMIKNRFQFYDLSDMPAEEIIASLEKISTQSKEEFQKVNCSHGMN